MWAVWKGYLVDHMGIADSEPYYGVSSNNAFGTRSEPKLGVRIRSLERGTTATCSEPQLGARSIIIVH